MELLEFMKNATKIMNTTEEFLSLTHDFNQYEIRILICMFLEEKCFDFKVDITEEIEMIRKVITEVNEEVGRYVR